MKNLFKNKIWLVIAVIAVIVIVTIIIAKYKKNKALNTLFSNSPVISTKVKTSSTAKPKSNFPLKVGSQGAEVENLQKYLNYFQGVKYPNEPQIKVNGYFGSDTLRVLNKLWNSSDVSENIYNQTIYPWILNFK